jgi:hypothetical protein
MMRIARGGPIPVAYSIPSEWWNARKAPASENEYLSGSQLYEHLSRQRALLRRLMGEKTHLKVPSSWIECSAQEPAVPFRGTAYQNVDHRLRLH